MEKVISIIKKSDDRNDFKFWQSKSYQERIDAIETLRSQYFQIKKMFSKDFKEFIQLLNRNQIEYLLPQLIGSSP